MLSISQLLKQMPPSEAARQYAAKAEAMLQDPLVVQFLRKHPQLTEHDLKLHQNRLYQYVKEYNNCSACPGLDRCPNDFTGHYTRLSVDESAGHPVIHDHKVSCKKFLAQESQNQIKQRIRSFYVDDRAFREGYSADEILHIDKDRTKAAKQVMEYMVKTRRDGLQTKGLYLVGGFGTGKTFLMCYLLSELAKSGYSGVIVYVPDFMEDLKAMFAEPAKLKETIEMLKNTDLLIFDDIGAENLSPWARDHVLGTILNYRMNRKPTFYTSNYELPALETHFSFTSKDGEEQYKGKRLMDRIRPFVEVVVVKGANRRGEA